VADTAWREKESAVAVAAAAVVPAVAPAAVAEDLYSSKSPQSMWNLYDLLGAYSPQAFSSAAAFCLSMRGLVRY
jgi:hypothetical protein